MVNASEFSYGILHPHNEHPMDTNKGDREPFLALASIPESKLLLIYQGIPQCVVPRGQT